MTLFSRSRNIYVRSYFDWAIICCISFQSRRLCKCNFDIFCCASFTSDEMRHGSTLPLHSELCNPGKPIHQVHSLTRSTLEIIPFSLERSFCSLVGNRPLLCYLLKGLSLFLPQSDLPPTAYGIKNILIPTL